MRHTFESGQWIDVVPIQGLRAKHKDAADAAVKLYVAFDKDGVPDLSSMPFSMSIAKARRNVLLAMLINAWSYTLCQLTDDGAPVDGSEVPLPVPVWHADGAQGFIENEESLGELSIDDFAELEDFFAPYLAKIQRRPDPKGTTTAGSSGTSPEKANRSQKT